MVEATQRRPATSADIEALEPNRVGEIVFGTLYSHPRPAPRHSRAASRLGQVTSPFDLGSGSGPGGWTILVEPELHLGSHTVVPELAGWKVERLTPMPTTAYIETPPGWIAEILSPSTQALDRTDKLAVNAEFGVAHCWYIDPLAKTLEVFALTPAKKWLLAVTSRNAELVTAPPFEVHTFSLDVLWVADDVPEKA